MVNDCGRNSKKLYTLVSNFTGTFKENPLLEGLSNEELAEQFAEFFIQRSRILDRVWVVMTILHTLSLNLADSQKRKCQA